ncbi:MAG: DUF1385 domain-containing protein [Actinobacteria bacterium]|nr:DUF1385 domain-containing protein [Actinomycetota bacterium]
MMRGVSHWSLAVRRPDDSIGVHDFPLRPYAQRHRLLALPIVRGVVALVESLVLGLRALQLSANESLGEEEKPLGKREMGVTLAISLVIAVGLFFLAPLGLASLLKGVLGTGFAFWIVEGLVRVLIFVLYIVAITRIPDLRRVFQYHGAEHMSIHALEHGEPLVPEAVENYRTLHVRCGTSFLLVVMVVAILVFAIVQWPAWYWLILSRVVLIPLIAGVSYEIIKWAGRHEDHWLVKGVMWPGLMLQRLTTRQPDTGQIEVAISALERIVELEPQDRPPVEGVEVMA